MLLSSAELVWLFLQLFAKEFGTTIVLSTHDPEVGIFAKRRIFIRDGLIKINYTYGGVERTITLNSSGTLNAMNIVLV